MTDLVPVMDGYECTRKIRLLPEPLRDVPIIGYEKLYFIDIAKKY